MSVSATELESHVARIKALDETTAALRQQLSAVADERAAVIRQLVEEGVRPAEIARALGVTRQAVNHLLRR